MRVIFLSFLLFGMAWGAAKVKAPPKANAAPKPEFTCDCGKRNTGRIFEGTPTKKNEYTWMAALEDEDFDHFCGGSIITERHILTAAHCFFDPETELQVVFPSNLSIVVGGHNLSEANEVNAQRFEVDQIITHENYSVGIEHNDIAIVVLSTKIIYNQNVGPICMPTEPLKARLTGEDVKITGWGLIEEEDTEERVHELRELDLKVVEHKNCEEEGASQICAYTEGKDVCKGDSGGALVWLHPTNHRLTQVGLVSYGLDSECGNVTQPGIYTDVTAYLDWIYLQLTPLSKETKTCHQK